MRYKGLLRKKEATPAFNLVQYATMGRQGARQCSSTAARHIAHTCIRQHAIAVARLQRRGGEATQPDSKRIAVPSATRIRQLASGVVVGAAAFGAEMGTRELEPSGSLAHGRRGCSATSTWRRVARTRALNRCSTHGQQPDPKIDILIPRGCLRDKTGYESGARHPSHPPQDLQDNPFFSSMDPCT